jgi:hypothetical protein
VLRTHNKPYTNTLGASKKNKNVKLNFIILFLFLSQISYCQTDNSIAVKDTVTLDPHYFILGTLSDYMGRFQYVDREKQIDRYYPYEKPLADYLTGYIKNQLNIEVQTIFKPSLHSEMFSEELSKALNSFYGENDQLLDDKFDTLNQKYSFITGLYYRYGESNNSKICKIQLANSPKHRNCYLLLKEIGCENIFYQYLRNIPAQYILYFEPTDELQKYFDIVELKRVDLRKSFLKTVIKMMGDAMTPKELKELKEQFKKSIDDDFEKVKTVFER